ncbi:methyl-accepting chemotaxis protein [Archangium lansingense]|uniref:Methyl-accepting chemotaxis protein n=1 Tax=Archangium lansingense TaxID=2995310 RepID=A0ABT4ALI9_9BACT|nr:methyl-accepting chemotaxis protein [Archangium lansinium]MCY1082561.1 methyl-accepting chemotaxis protein [Archangium lansinium]
MSIGKKIAAGFGLSLLVLLIVAAVAFQGARELRGATVQMVESQQTVDRVDELISHMVDAEAHQRNYLITGKEDFLTRYRASVSEAKAALQRLRDSEKDDAEQSRRIMQVEPLFQARLDSLATGVELRQERGQDAALAYVSSGQGTERMRQVRQLTAELLNSERALWEKRQREAETTSDRVLLIIGLGSALGTVLVALSSIRLTRGITGALDKLVKGAEQIGRGNFAHRIEVNSADETGELARAFNTMAERRQQAEAQLAKQAEEREHTLRTVAEFVNQLTATTAEILASTTEQVAGAQEQGSAVAETVSTVEEIAQMSEEAAGRARGVSESARHSEEVGKSGRRAVDEAIAAMGTVREQVESIASRILALAEQAQAIGDIITTVNDISEQTHMLALNASIEASRAGEHGRGFAVVAAEVKALADQSKKATAQVRQILGQIQKATQGAVMTTEEGTKSVASATRVVTQAGATIQTLGELLGQASLTAAQISASASQQATGTGQIRQAMRDVSQATQQTLTSIRQTERAVQDLNAMGQKLKGLLSEYGRAA